MIDRNLSLPIIAFLQVGFRPFFLGAAIFAMLSTGLWMGVYTFGLQLPVTHVSYFQWHAHEMIFGYGAAVIAGFLLTAVRNWTQMETLRGTSLLGLFGLWISARVLFLFGTQFISLAALIDISFMLFLCVSVVRPVAKTRNWKQIGILSKLALLTLGNIFFYVGAVTQRPEFTNWGVYGGLFLIIGLIITLGRRLIPLFIEKGVGYPVTLFNSKWLDMSSLILFLAFFIVQVFVDNKEIAAPISMALFLITTARLIGWHTVGIWRKPLLWGLFVSFLFIDFGFLLTALNPIVDIPRSLAVHAFAMGIGLVTLSMMARVSLGHTGRDVHSPPTLVGFFLGVLTLGGIVRVVIPILDPGSYLILISSSQFLWIAAFAVFAFIYTPILLKPRIDGKFG